MQDQQKIIRLTSNTGEELDPVIENQTITPLYREEPQQDLPKQEMIVIDENTAKFVEQQSNKVVTFLINWIRTAFAKTILDYLNNDYKQELIKELKK